jgi:hypothetical protein
MPAIHVPHQGHSPESPLLEPLFGQTGAPGASREVFAGQSVGVRWAVLAGLDGAGRLSTFVTRTHRGATATSGVTGSPPRDGQLICMWIGRAPDLPPFLLLRTAPEVTHATAVLATGVRRQVALSPVIEDFRLRFGAAPLPDEDPLASIEIGRWLRGTQIVHLWRPPGRPRPAALRPRPHTT